MGKFEGENLFNKVKKWRTSFDNLEKYFCTAFSEVKAMRMGTKNSGKYVATDCQTKSIEWKGKQIDCH